MEKGKDFTASKEIVYEFKTKTKEFIWEHFGLMDNPDYANRTASKLKVFNENKIFPGKNLIITMETAETQPHTQRFLQRNRFFDNYCSNKHRKNRSDGSDDARIKRRRHRDSL